MVSPLLPQPVACQNSKKNLDFLGVVIMHVLASIGLDVDYHFKSSVSPKLKPSETATGLAKALEVYSIDLHLAVHGARTTGAEWNSTGCVPWKVAHIVT